MIAARNRAGAALVVSLVLVAALSLTGCGTTGKIKPEQYCFKVASATVHAVDLGMTVSGDLHAQGKLSDATRDKLVAGHDVYRPVARTVVAGCRVVSTQEEADALVDRLSVAADKLLSALVAAGGL